MIEIRLGITLSGPDLRKVVLGLASAGLLPPERPRLARVREQPLEPADDWVDEAADLALTTGILLEHGDGGTLWADPGRIVTLLRPRFAVDDASSRSLATALARVPFELASLSGLYAEWQADADVVPPLGFGGGHNLFGWAVAFRGAGHDRLRRGCDLDAGPWHLERVADLTFIRFHDLRADATAAAAAARIGHQQLAAITRPH